MTADTTEQETVPAAYIDLVRALTHDVRTPLSTIIGFADMMENEMLGSLGNPSYQGYAADICKAGLAILDTLNDITETARFTKYTTQQNEFQNLIDLAPDLICMVRDGKIELINPAGAGMLEVWPSQALAGRAFIDFVHADHRDKITPDLADLARQQNRVPLAFQRPSGVDLEVEVAAVPYRDAENAETGAVLVIARDVTERNRAVNAVAQREENLRLVMDAVGDGIVVFDGDGNITMSNAAVENMFGLAADALAGTNIAALLPVVANRGVDAFLAAAGGTSDMRLEDSLEITGIHANGGAFPVEVVTTQSQLEGKPRYVAAIRDIQKRKEYEDRLRRLASRDELTGLANRNLLAERLGEAMADADRHGRQLALIYVDLDQFQNINNAMGHETGDAVIKLAAQRIKSCTSDGTTVARVGGDEFHILIRDLDTAGYEEDLAGDLLVALSSPYMVDGREIYSSASIGVARYPEHGKTASELARNVDTAVNNAKRSGRATYKVYLPRMSDEVQRRVDVGHCLRRALDKGELSLHYQAKVDLLSERITGAEALLRWHSAKLGFVSPAEFIPIAEETGLIVPIGDWVLKTACNDAAAWPQHLGEDVQVSVNLSALQFTHGDIISKVRSSLLQSGLSPKRLDLELTESLLVERPEETIDVLKTLKRMGISISMDDFGTGYSSLSYLTRFPLDSLKVDRAFVTDLPSDKDAVVVVRAIVGMAQQLKLHIVAEGIETEGQKTFLQALGCQTGQGYLFSKPLPLIDFYKALEPQAAE